MKWTSFLSNLFWVIWIVAHFIFCGIAAFVLWGMMGMHFDSVHTSNTGFDPIRGLTRETVIQNIFAATWRWIFIVPLTAASVYFISDVVWEHMGKRGQRTALFLSLLCAALLSGAIILAGVQCFLKYPQR